jgi:hypothetical protein
MSTSTTSSTIWNVAGKVGSSVWNAGSKILGILGMSDPRYVEEDEYDEDDENEDEESSYLDGSSKGINGDKGVGENFTLYDERLYAPAPTSIATNPLEMSTSSSMASLNMYNGYDISSAINVSKLNNAEYQRNPNSLMAVGSSAVNAVKQDICPEKARNLAAQQHPPQLISGYPQQQQQCASMIKGDYKSNTQGNLQSNNSSLHGTVQPSSSSSSLVPLSSVRSNANYPQQAIRYPQHHQQQQQQQTQQYQSFVVAPTAALAAEPAEIVKAASTAVTAATSNHIPFFDVSTITTTLEKTPTQNRWKLAFQFNHQKPNIGSTFADPAYRDNYPASKQQDQQNVPPPPPPSAPQRQIQYSTPNAQFQTPHNAGCIPSASNTKTPTAIINIAMQQANNNTKDPSPSTLTYNYTTPYTSAPPPPPSMQIISTSQYTDPSVNPVPPPRTATTSMVAPKKTTTMGPPPTAQNPTQVITHQPQSNMGTGPTYNKNNNNNNNNNANNRAIASNGYHHSTASYPYSVASNQPYYHHYPTYPSPQVGGNVYTTTATTGNIDFDHTLEAGMSSSGGDAKKDNATQNGNGGGGGGFFKSWGWGGNGKQSQASRQQQKQQQQQHGSQHGKYEEMV